MIGKWKKQLIEWGFIAQSRQSYYRETPSFFHWVHETSLRVGEKAVRLGLAVSIKDPFLDDQGFGRLDLCGDLTPMGVFVNFDETPYWIEPSEEPQVHQVLVHCHQSWFQHWSSVGNLIAYLKRPVPIVATEWRPGPSVPTLRKVAGVATRQRPITDYWLSLLDYHCGAPRDSLTSAEKWLRHVQHLQDGGAEPSRTLRQIAELTEKPTE